MRKEDADDFANALKDILKSYNQECGVFTLRVWWLALRIHPLKDVLNALGAYCADPDRCKFAPKAGDIVGMIEGTKADRAELAVIAFARAIENANAYDTVVFDDPAIHYAVKVGFGSWVDMCAFCDSKFEHQEKRRSFLAAYRMFKDGTAYEPRLSGLHEQAEVTSGIPSGMSIVYIGERTKALAVEQSGRIGGNNMEKIDSPNKLLA